MGLLVQEGEGGRVCWLTRVVHGPGHRGQGGVAVEGPTVPKRRRCGGGDHLRGREQLRGRAAGGNPEGRPARRSVGHKEGNKWWGWV